MTFENNDKKRILFVCTGNTCRSPMAEALAAQMLPLAEVSSAGVAAVAGLPASLGAVEAVRELGLNLDHHRSRPLSSYLLADADLVLCLAESHKQVILSALPEYADKVYTLTEYVDEIGDIADPFGEDASVYRECATRLQELIILLANKLAAE